MADAKAHKTAVDASVDARVDARAVLNTMWPVAKCDAMAGTEKHACMTMAKSSYGK